MQKLRREGDLTGAFNSADLPSQPACLEAELEKQPRSSIIEIQAGDLVDTLDPVIHCVAMHLESLGSALTRQGLAVHLESGN